MFSGERDDRHVLAAALGGLADVDQLHAVRLGGELLPVRLELGVAGHLVIVADVEAEGLFGGGDFGRGLGGERPGGQHHG